MEFVYIPNRQGNTNLKAGDTGTIVAIDTHAIGVAWDKPLVCGHNIGGLCEYGYGWFVGKENITLLKEQEEQFELASESELMQLLFCK